MYALPEIYVGPGEFIATDQPTLAKVILGSCVAISLFCARTRMGAVNHAVLPTGPNGNTRFVDVSIRNLLGWFQSKGVGFSELEIGLFGGGQLFADSKSPICALDVGKQNVERALAILKEYELSPGVQDVGGYNGRRLSFNTGDGSMKVDKIAPPENTPPLP